YEKPHAVMPSWNPSLTICIKSASGGVIAKSSTKSRPIESLRWLAGRLEEQGLHLSKGQNRPDRFPDAVISCGARRPRHCEGRIHGRESRGVHPVSPVK